MRYARPLVLALPAFALGVLATATLTTTAHAQFGGGAGKALPKAAKWEYELAEAGPTAPPMQQIDAEGAKGWELVQVVRLASGGSLYYMKREVQ